MMKKQVTKTILGLIITVFTFCCVQAQSVSVWDGTSAIWTQGSGTENDPYLIQSAQNLAWIADMVNSGITTYEGVNFLLNIDLNLGSLSWLPIGLNETNCFKGHFDGGGHFVDNLYVSSQTYRGLFGYVNNAVIENVSAKVTIGSSSYSAGLVGYANAISISNCHIREGTINGVQYSGGIVAYCEGSLSIERCSNAANIIASGNVYAAGGICGKVSNNSSKVFTNCHNTGSVSATKTTCSENNYTVCAGGICGVGEYCIFTNCFNKGEITATNNNQYVNYNYYNYKYNYDHYSTSIAGGIAGKSSSSYFNFCYNIGGVSSISYDRQSDNTTYNETPSYWYEYHYKYYYQCQSGGICPSGVFRYCYNKGPVSASKTNTANIYGVGSLCYNSYNTGNLTSSNTMSSKTRKYGVGDNVTNCHYLQDCGASEGGTSKTEASMKSASFPIILNADSTVFCMDITPNVNDGYPIYANSSVYIITQQADNINFTSATIRGVYYPYVDVVGFEYKPSSAENYTTVYTNVGSPAEYQLTELQSGTSYSYRFFVQKDGFTYYGNELSFTTLACDLQASISESVTEMCNGEIATFTASCSSSHSNMFTYQWNNSEEGNIIQVNDGAPYTVTVQDTNGCTTTASASVVILPLPQGVISGNTMLCPGESTVLTASGANRYNWSTGASSPTITVNASGTYTCTFTNSYNCSMTQSVEVSVLDAPTISGELNICEGGSTTLTASGGASYVWNNGASTPSITVNNAGIYTVTATSGNCSATASVTTAIIPIPQVTISGNPIICSGVSTTLTASPGSSYLWSTGETTPSISVNSPGTYSVTVTNSNGCSNSATQTVSLMEPTTISGDSHICSGENATLIATGTGSYQWSNGANTPSITVNTPGSYSVTVSLPNGCSSSATIEVTAALLPTPSISGNNVICEGQSTTLTATGGNSYSWSNGSTQNSIIVTQSGNYTVSVTNTDGCSASTSTTVTVNPLPNVTISGNSSFCQGSTTTLTANGANSYLWSNASTEESISIGDAGTYTVTGSDVNGCTNTASQMVSVNPTYNTPFTHSICEGESYNFYGQNLTLAGTYTHTLQTINGCDSMLTLTLTVKTLPIPSITGNTLICEGQSTTLTAAGGNNYSWNTGSTNSSINVNQSGVYTVTATNAEGCSACTSTTVTVNPLPTITISGNTTVCQGSSTTLTASGANSYSWSTGENTASVSISSFGVYTVTGTSAEGCSNTADVTVLVSQLPVITITGETDFCAGESTTLTANGGENYLWNDGTTDAEFTVNIAGTYQVIGYNAAGCYSMESVTVNQWQPASSEFTITTNEDCYEWNGQSYCQTGDYTQTFQTIHGCDSVVILHLTIETGIDNYAMNVNMNIYPNPTSDVVNVQLTMNNEQLGNVTIQVYDVFGKMLDMVNVGNSDAMNRVPTGHSMDSYGGVTNVHGLSAQIIQIDLSRYANGVYFIKAVSEGNVLAVKKVVKNR